LAESPENPEKHELLNPKNDFLFKKIFAAPGNEDLLIDMLKTRAQYLSQLKWKMDYFSSMKTAESRGWEKGMEKGEAKDICRFLFKRFGITPVGLQEKVRQLTDLEILDDVLTHLFPAGSPEEAQRFVEEGLNKSLPQA